MDLRKSIEIAISYEQKNMQEILAEVRDDKTSSNFYLQNKLLLHREHLASLMLQLWRMDKQREKFSSAPVYKVHETRCLT